MLTPIPMTLNFHQLPAPMMTRAHCLKGSVVPMTRHATPPIEQTQPFATH
jgi:hypothetical protein